MMNVRMMNVPMVNSDERQMPHEYSVLLASARARGYAAAGA
jgi:hypothetical protein